MKKVFFQLFFLSLLEPVTAQILNSTAYQEFHMHRGFVIPHHEDMYHLYRPVHALQYQYLKPMDNHPNAKSGYLVYASDLGSRYLGWSLSANVLFEKTLLNWGNTECISGLSMGVGYVSNPYHVTLNPHNRAIGSYLNAFGQFYLGSRTVFDHGIGLNAQLRFSHFSNGGAKAPNLGINIPSFSLGISKTISTKPSVKFKTDTSGYFGFASIRTGIKNDDIDDTRVFWVPVFEGGFLYQNQGGGALRVALSMIADPLYRFEKFTTLDPFTFSNGLEMGMSLGYQYRLDRWMMLVDLGVYLYQPKRGIKTPYYEALGLGYQCNKNWQLIGRLKANKAKADLIEWGIIYCWN
jgi:hypothetical protein